MFKDEKIDRTKPSNRVLVTVNKSKNLKEIRRHLLFVDSIAYPLTRKSLPRGPEIQYKHRHVLRA